MEQFKPSLSIVAVDEQDAVVIFDFVSATDSERSPKALRIPRNFKELSAVVTAFESFGEHSDRKEYRGSVKLSVESLDGAVTQHVLAEPHLCFGVESRRRTKGADQNTPCSPEAVTRAVRMGVADALARALVVFYSHGAHAVAGDVTLATSDARPVRDGLVSRVQPFAASVTAANNDVVEKKRFRKKVTIAAIATPLVVFGLLSVAGMLKKNDPIEDAVAKAMIQSPSSTQAQVEITKETLRQMGLDPGKSGDIGCLAAN